MNITEVVGSLLALAGAAWTLLGALGLLRFPDVYTRLHGAGLGSSGGITLILVGAAVHFSSHAVTFSLLALLTIVFILLSSPLGSTAMLWAAHRTGTPQMAVPVVDEMDACDDAEPEKTAAPPQDPSPSAPPPP